MRFIIIPLTLTFLLVGCKNASPADAAPETADTREAEKQIPVMAVEEVVKALASGAVAVDANSDSTRKKNGTLPDAVILTSSYKYDLAQLPADKSKDLIFYCGSTSCTASDTAAARAASNGYDNVHIMREGIKGWKDAGKPTTPFTDS